MSQNPHVGCRIPPDWHQQIIAVCEVTGQTSSQVLQEAIALYLKRSKIPAVRSRLEALEEKVKKLDLLLTHS
jgi:galactitol-specific phosphotransferase system IIB component